MEILDVMLEHAKSAFMEAYDKGFLVGRDGKEYDSAKAWMTSNARATLAKE